MKIEFTVFGNPIPWRRAGRKGQQYYTHHKVAEYQEEIIGAFLKKYSLSPLPIFPKGELATRFKFYRDNRRRCDLSNLEKLVEDALEGYVWADDRQIAQRAKDSGRYYDKESPRLEVEVWEVE